MSWMSESKRISEWLYNLNVNDTFTIVYGNNLELTEYATVTNGPYNNRKNYYNSGLAEPYDIIVDVNLRKNPSSDFANKCSISYDPKNEDLFVKRGVNQFEPVKSVCTDALEASYESEKQLVAECGECGTKTKISVLGDGTVNSESMRKNSDGDILTPCCFTENWNTKLDN